MKVSRRKLIQGLGALAFHKACAQEAPKGITADMSDPSKLEYEVGIPDLSVGMTANGHILSLKLGASKVTMPFHACTFLASCSPEGTAAHRSIASGGAEFRRAFVHEATRVRCTVVDRFIPASSSIRWEVEVVGSETPWSTAIETQLAWLEPSGLSCWTAWDRPSGTGVTTVEDERFDNLLNKVQQQTAPSEELDAARGVEDKWIKAEWNDPLATAPFADLNLRYGGFLGSPNAFSIPIVTVTDEAADLGLSLIQSPETDILDMRLRTSTFGDVALSRSNYRISSRAPIKIAMDLVPHAADWRAGLGWMVERYPSYFIPPNRLAYELDGCGSYADDKYGMDADKLKKMAYSLNWNARFDWPFQGMDIPPVNKDVVWKSWYQKEVSLEQMDRYDEKMERSGFHVLEDFVTTECGNYIQDVPPPRKAQADSELWRDGNDFIHYQIPDAVVRDIHGKILYSNWFKDVRVDPGEPSWQNSLLAQAETLVKQLPHSSGICIDRMDWLATYNLNRDDGLSWIDNRPARSLILSWKETLRKLGAVLHPADKVIYANTIIARVDCCEHLDGFYDEYGDFPSSLNLCALLSVRKPAIAWTRTINTLRPNPDAFFQRHLHLGVFPTVPFPGADHTIGEDSWVDQLYLDYGPLLSAIRGKRWVLKPHVISVENNQAHANLFQVPGGYAIPITFAKHAKEVTVKMRKALDAGEQIISVSVLHPGESRTLALQWQAAEDGISIKAPLVRSCAVLQVKCASAAARS